MLAIYNFSIYNGLVWGGCLFVTGCLAITYTSQCNELIIKIKSPLVVKAGNNPVTKRPFLLPLAGFSDTNI